jgi:hypothetical protein
MALGRSFEKQEQLYTTISNNYIEKSKIIIWEFGN